MTVSMTVAMTVPMAVTMEAMNGAAETAMDRAAMQPSVGARYRFCARRATAPRHKSHRHGADRGTPHQCQYDAA